MEGTDTSGRKTRKKRKKWKLTRSAPPFRPVDVSVGLRGLPPLHMACLYGQLTTIHRLIYSRKESIDGRDFEGRQPLHVTLSSQSLPFTSLCLTYLLEHGADVNSKCDSGRTPLHMAAAEGLLDCAKILVEAGADVMALDNMGHTPLIMACVWSHREVGRYLRNCMWHVEKTRELQERQIAESKCSKDVVELRDGTKRPEEEEVDAAEAAARSRRPP